MDGKPSMKWMWLGHVNHLNFEVSIHMAGRVKVDCILAIHTADRVMFHYSLTIHTAQK